MMICAIPSMFLLSSLTPTLSSRVQVTSPAQPITTGGVLAIQCEIWDVLDEYIVKIFRVTAHDTDEITTDDSYINSWLGQRVFLSIRAMPGGRRVHFMTITDVSLQDKGEYLCTINSNSRGKYEIVAEDAVNVDVYFMPDSTYPSCHSKPVSTTSLSENTELKLVCSSKNAIPYISLVWSSTNTNAPLSHRNIIEGNLISSEINLFTKEIHDGMVFTCTLSSSGFPDVERSCHIGPINGRKTQDGGSSIALPKPTTISITHDTVVPADCSKDCPMNSTILYLSISMVVASILWVVFLTTTIMMCCKYKDISTMSTQARESRHLPVPVDDGTEPVYVSLQTRQDYDRNSVCSTYMTLDDPNNPGNKVIMPKEVFDEFYRTLTLKRV